MPIAGLPHADGRGSRQLPRQGAGVDRVRGRHRSSPHSSGLADIPAAAAGISHCCPMWWNAVPQVAALDHAGAGDESISSPTMHCGGASPRRQRFEPSGIARAPARRCPRRRGSSLLGRDRGLRRALRPRCPITAPRSVEPAPSAPGGVSPPRNERCLRAGAPAVRLFESRRRRCPRCCSGSQDRCPGRGSPPVRRAPSAFPRADRGWRSSSSRLEGEVTRAARCSNGRTPPRHVRPGERVGHDSQIVAAALLQAEALDDARTVPAARRHQRRPCGPSSHYAERLLRPAPPSRPTERGRACRCRWARRARGPETFCALACFDGDASPPDPCPRPKTSRQMGSTLHSGCRRRRHPR